MIKGCSCLFGSQAQVMPKYRGASLGLQLGPALGSARIVQLKHRVFLTCPDITLTALELSI